jgi:hypothetical protein
MHESYKKWLDDGQPKMFCKCSRHEEIIIKENHKWNGIPQYVNGHNKGGLGKHHSIESKKKISDNNIGQPCSEDTKQKISKANKGKVSPNKDK